MVLQPRYVVNQVLAGNYDCPKKVLNFLIDLHAAFRMLNLRNDFLRKKFDSKLSRHLLISPMSLKHLFSVSWFWFCEILPSHVRSEVWLKKSWRSLLWHEDPTLGEWGFNWRSWNQSWIIKCNLPSFHLNYRTVLDFALAPLRRQNFAFWRWSGDELVKIKSGNFQILLWRFTFVVRRILIILA